MKILLALIALAATTGNAQAQSRTLYDASGKVVGRSSTDSSGTVTNYDSRGRVISRETMTGNTTTVYDAGGRSVRFTRVAKALLPWRQRTNVWREVTSSARGEMREAWSPTCHPEWMTLVGSIFDPTSVFS